MAEAVEAEEVGPLEAEAVEAVRGLWEWNSRKIDRFHITAYKLYSVIDMASWFHQYLNIPAFFYSAWSGTSCAQL